MGTYVINVTLYLQSII